MHKTIILSLSLLAIVHGQHVGTLTPEVHPKLNSQKCTTGTGCTTESTSVVLDANWRWLHSTSGSSNCYTGNSWDKALCPDPVSCATNCAVEGADYSGTYGITSDGDALTLKFVTHGAYSTNIGSRVYLLGPDDTNYEIFKLKNQEFTFDIDVSNLPCGLNGALYFTEMAADGGLSEFSGNQAGAKYGTGYCDAQCPQDIKFIDGEANMMGWNPSSGDPNSGTGQYGSCCTEMDIWEANFNAAAFTPHVCSSKQRCTGTDCGAGNDRYKSVCDKDGCDFNSWRMGNDSFLGQGKEVDTNFKFTVMTQFITADNTANGALTEVRRLYVQNGKVIQNSKVDIPGMDAFDSITDGFCSQQKTAFGDLDIFENKGGLKAMGESMDRGMVLVMSLWDDHAADMLWLDSEYPTTKSSSTPGVSRGPCSASSGSPVTVESQSGDASVTFSNIKVGDIGSTFVDNAPVPAPPVSVAATPAAKPIPKTTVAAVPTSTRIKGHHRSGGHHKTATHKSTATQPATASAIAKYFQCGGTGYTGSKTCVAGTSCKALNAYYSQCL